MQNYLKRQYLRRDCADCMFCIHNPCCLRRLAICIMQHQAILQLSCADCMLCVCNFGCWQMKMHQSKPLCKKGAILKRRKVCNTCEQGTANTEHAGSSLRERLTNVEACTVVGVIKIKVVDLGLIIRIHNFSFLEELDPCTRKPKR